MFKPDYSKLENDIGYHFKNRSLLEEALTHSSYANELGQKGIRIPSNERLEFLGDSVLSIVSTTLVFTEYPDCPEGEMTRIRSQAICTEALSSYASSFSLGSYLFLGNGEKKGNGKNKPTTLENAFEALLGAIYLDSGSELDAVKGFVVPFLSERFSVAETDSNDYKSELQRIIQETPGEELTYEEVDHTGPDNAPTFTMVAKLNSNIIGRGTGHKKKIAEQNAAKDALTRYIKKPD